MNNSETQAKLGARHRTKTNNIKNTTQNKELEIKSYKKGKLTSYVP